MILFHFKLFAHQYVKCFYYTCNAVLLRIAYFLLISNQQQEMR